MSNILCVWEMGSSLGHMTSLKPFVDKALAHGHCVTLAFKELQNIHVVFPDNSLPRFQAPYFYRPPVQTYQPLLSFTQLLLQRFETADELQSLCLSWQAIFDAVRPDLVIYDFAPVAQLASHGAPWQKWATGNAFTFPRTDLPYLGVFPGVTNTPDNVASLDHAETRLLKLSNEVLPRLGKAPLDDVRTIYDQLDRQWILSCPELDHYGRRAGQTYFGKSLLQADNEPMWPQGPGPRVFGYVSDCNAIEPLLLQLERYQASVVIYSRDLPQALKERFRNIQFATSPVNMQAITEQADLVVNMSNQGTVLPIFLAGIPQIVLPRRQEQVFLAWRLQEQNAGVAIRPESKEVSDEVKRAMNLARKGRQPRRNGVFDEFNGQRLERAIDTAIADIPTAAFCS